MSAPPPTADMQPIGSEVRFVPSPDSRIAAIVSSSITLPGAPDEQCWNEIRRRRRLLSPRAVEHAQHGKCHGLNTGFNGRNRHRRE
jgi:ribosomal protein S13